MPSQQQAAATYLAPYVASPPLRSILGIIITAMLKNWIVILPTLSLILYLI
jgi:hypothetical protein